MERPMLTLRIPLKPAAFLILWLFFCLWAERLHGAESLSGTEPLIVAQDYAWPPFAFLDERGQPQGVLVDLWQAMGRQMGRDVVFFLTDWKGSIEAVREGKAHVHGGLIASPERSEFFDFSADILPVQAFIFVASAGMPLDLSELRGRKVGVTEGSYEQEFMEKEYPDALLIPFSNNERMIQAALAGKMDLFVADYPVGLYLLDRHGSPGVFHPLKMLYSRNLAAGFPRGNEALQEALDVCLATLSKEEIRRLTQRWMRSEKVEVLPFWFWPGLGFGIFFLVSSILAVYSLALRRQRRWLLGEVERKNAALRQSEAEFRLLFENAATALMVHDRETCAVIHANRRAVERHGPVAAPGGVHTQMWTESPYTFEDAQRWFARVREEGPQRFEWKSRTVAGPECWEDVHLHEVRLSGVLRIVSTAVDITERKKIEKDFQDAKRALEAANLALQESEVRFRSLADNTAAGIYVLQGRRFKVVNPAMSQILGYEEQELLSRDLSFFVHPDDRALVLSRARDRQAGLGVPPRYEMKVLTRDGLARWVEVSAVSLRYQGRPAIFGTFFDITERKEAERLREESMALLRKVSVNIPGVIYQFRMRADGRSCFPYISSRIREILPVSPQDLAKDAGPLLSRIHADDLSSVYSSMRVSAHRLLPWRAQFRVRYTSGAYRWCEGQSTPEKEKDGSVVWYGYLVDIQDWKDAQDRMTHMALHDTLTGLPNRILFEDRAGQILVEAQREQRAFALVFIDLDHFKPINDTLGHGIGDQVLKEAAVRIREHIRASDTAARIGGDEFVVLLRGLHDRGDAEKVAEKIRRALKNPIVVGERPLQISASIGIALYPEHGQDLITLTTHADRAMYSSKKRGRDAISFYAEALTAK